MKKEIFLIGLLLAMLALAGCTQGEEQGAVAAEPETAEPEGPSCPTCPDASNWSQCSDEAVKTRTNYRCGEDTDFECVNYRENMDCDTQLVVKGALGIMDVTVSPTIEERVKGIIEVEAENVPEDANSVIFILAAQGVELSENMSEEDLARMIREHDLGKEDGWKILFDTTAMENGLYNISVLVPNEDAPEHNPWFEYSVIQIVVDN